MSAKVVFFASIREDLGVESVDIEVDAPCRLPALIELIVGDKAAIWRETLTAENIRVAINQELTNGDCQIRDGDEVAFFPPVTGG